MFEKGHIPWNKGLTKEVDERVRFNTIRSGRSNRGKIPWNLGKSWSKEIKEKISKAKMNPSEEIRRKISLSHADVCGRKNPNWGKHCSEETKAKISRANKGKKRTEEVKKNLSRIRKGRKKSKEFCKKISEIMKGKANPMRGRNHTEEAKKKISEAQRGAKASNWKGGITPLYHLIQGCVTYKLWREAIFTRDHFQCQDCGDNQGGNLNAHHLHHFVQLVEENNVVSLGQAIRTEELWDLNNGITLCEECHRKRHKIKEEEVAGVVCL